jgi:hypothetical protein
MCPIQDTLEVLMSKDIKINNSNNRFGKEAGDGADADDGSLNSEEKEKALAAAKGKLLSKARRLGLGSDHLPHTC